MKSRLVDFWLYLRASYWFIPMLMALAALLLSAAMIHLDDRFGTRWLKELSWLYANQPDGARALLSTVAGTMITVAGVTFSMTLLAVSHASAQIGQRLLTGFMRDRGNQLTLGTFIATFLYCLMVLRTVRTGADDQNMDIAVFVPHLSILVAVVLTILSVMVLIYFFHHVPQSISVTNVVARVGGELVDSIRSIYPAQRQETERENSLARFNARRGGIATDVRLAGRGGYLRVLDNATLVEIAADHELHVSLSLKPGDFAVTGQRLMSVSSIHEPDKDITRHLQACFSWGNERTPERDVLFSAEQLLEVLGRALSPGINGQFTALLCLDQFERALAELLARQDPRGMAVDASGEPRVKMPIVSRQEFVTELFAPIRQYARGDWITTRHVLTMLRRLAELCDDPGTRAMLAVEASLVLQDAKASAMTEHEKQTLRHPCGSQ